jgi:hypothetical protein
MFNALRYIEELEKAGFTHNQAEVSARVLIDVMNENFATKPDIKELDLKVGAAIQKLDSKIEAAVEKLDSKIDSVVERLDSAVERLDSKIDSVAYRLDAKIDSSSRELEYRLTIKLGTIVGAMITLAIGVTATMVKLIQH